MGTNEQMKALEDGLIELIEQRDEHIAKHATGGKLDALTPRMHAAELIKRLPIESRCHAHGAFEYECPLCAAEEVRAIMREGSVEDVAFHLFSESFVSVADKDAVRVLWDRAPASLRARERDRARVILAVATGEDD